MTERDAAAVYFWGKIRQCLKHGHCGLAMRYMTSAEKEYDGLGHEMMDRAGKTFTAGCVVLGDPAPLNGESDQ